MNQEKRSLPILGGAIALPMQAKASPAPARAGDEVAENERRFRPDVYWYFTFRCNLACEHCSVFSSPEVDTSGDMTTAQALQVVEQLVELNVKTALISGGEALYRPDAVQILRAIVEAGVHVGLESNGVVLSDEFLDFATEWQKRGLFSICISVDGGTAEAHDKVRGRNAFRRTVENLRRLKSRGIHFDIQCILNKHNYPTIPDYMALARELFPALGLAQFGFLNPVGRGDSFVQEVGLTYDDMPAIFALIAQEQPTFPGKIVVKAPPATIPARYLGLVYSSGNMIGTSTCQFPLLGILPNGDVTICALSRDNDAVSLGNVKRDRLAKIWQETRMDMLRAQYVAADHLEGICSDCVFQQSCKGSCRAWAFEQGGTFDAPFPLCAMLEKAGQFPKAYRLSEQRKAVSGVRATGLLAEPPAKSG